MEAYLTFDALRAGLVLLFAPFQIFAGWVSAAVFVNIASALQHQGVKVGNGLSAVLILATGVLGTTIAYLTSGWLYALTVAWALFGLVIANTVRTRNPGIAVLSGALIPVVLGATVIAALAGGNY